MGGVQGSSRNTIESPAGRILSGFFYTNWSSVPGFDPKIEIGVVRFNALGTASETTCVGNSWGGRTGQFCRGVHQPDRDPPPPV